MTTQTTETRRILLKLTCSGCPEQYDAFLDGKQVGYLRLRHGGFTVDYPECGGETIYSADPKGDGSFYPDEREYYLSRAVQAILDKIDGVTRKPDVLYTVEGGYNDY